jgi:hypothetical protein
MPVFQANFIHTLTLSGSIAIRAKNEDEAEDKAEKIREQIMGITAWTLTATGKADEITWEEDENATELESVS